MYGSGQSGDPVHTGTTPQATSSDPVASSTHPTSTSTREPVGKGGTGSIQQGSTPLSSSRMLGTFDDDVGSTSSIKSGLPGNSHGYKMTGLPESRDPLDTNKALPREPTTEGAGAYDSSIVAQPGPHSSISGDKIDSRVNPDLDRSGGLESRGTTGNTSGPTGSSLPGRTVGKYVFYRLLVLKCLLIIISTESKSDIGRSFPLGGSSADTATSGPYSSDLANKADPRVDSDRDGSHGLGSSSGFGSGTGPVVSPAHQGGLTRSNVSGSTAASADPALSRGYGEETWTHDHNKHGHEYAGDPCENEPPAPGAVHFTSGPHSLDTANRLDPRVSGGTSGFGTGTTGVGAYEASHDESSSSTTQHGASTAGPHKSDLLNKADPRVDSDLSKQRRPTAMSDTAGAGTTSSTEPSTSRDHRYGTDTTVAGAGLGAAGAALHGQERDHNSQNPEGISSGYSNPYPSASADTKIASGPASSTRESTDLTRQVPSGTASSTGPTSTGATDPTSRVQSGVTNENDQSTTSKDHHIIRDAGLVSVGAGTAYEADEHAHGSHSDIARTHDSGLTSSQQPSSGTSAPEHGRETSLSGAGTTVIYDSRHQPSSTSGPGGQSSTAYADRNRTSDSHMGRDTVISAGAGAAAVAGGAELSRKDLERQQKAEYEKAIKEREAAHKQELKDQKHHQHEEEKAAKAHEKALAKEEKHHQHEKEKAEKAHEKALAKEEAKHKHSEESQESEKKHHGLLGLFHREKPDKELREDEIARKERLEAGSHPGAGTTAAVGSAATGTAGLSELEKHERAKEHDRNRLHKDAPPGYGQTKYAEAPTEGYASQVTGGTGTAALAQGGRVSQGSHLTGVGNKADPRYVTDMPNVAIDC